MDIDAIPLWLQDLSLALIPPLLVEAGYHLYALGAKGRAGARFVPGEAAWGQITTASISLLGLLLAFTVSMAVEHYESRRQLVVDEANAIGTTYLRAQLFDEPARDRLSSLLAKFARDRELVFQAGDSRAKIEQSQATTTENERLLWLATADGLRQPRDGMWSIPFLQTMNEMFDLAATREASLEARVPARVVWLDILYALVTAGIVGYALGASGARRRIASTLIFLMVGLTIGLILDLDHPRSGGITVPEAPLLGVTTWIAQSEAAKTRVVIVGPTPRNHPKL